MEKYRRADEAKIKELNQIVREKVRLVAQLGLEIEEHQERLKILEDHLKSVKMELVHT